MSLSDEDVERIAKRVKELLAPNGVNFFTTTTNATPASTYSIPADPTKWQPPAWGTSYPYATGGR